MTLDIEGVLAGHQRITSQLGGPCWCGRWPTADHEETWMAHVAAVLREQIAAWLGSEGLREIAAYAVERAEKPKNATYDDVARAALTALAAQVAPSRVSGEGS